MMSFQCMQVNAQRDGDRHERIQAMKIAYITERLELTPAEAEKFWPVYNDYNSKKAKVLQDIRRVRRHYIENHENMNEEEHLELLEKFIKLQKEDADLLPSYQEKFIEVLPPKKVMKLYIAEIQFKNYLLQKLRDHQGQVHENKPE